MNLSNARKTATAAIKQRRADTAARYERTGRRVLRQLQEGRHKVDAAGLHALARELGWSRATYHQSRTALAFTLALTVRERAREYDRARRDGDKEAAALARAKAEGAANAIEAVQAASADGLKRGKKTRSPARGLAQAQRHARKREVADWRMDLAHSMARRDDRGLVAVMAATGARPVELIAGVALRHDNAGNLVARICGAKCSQDRGQPVRELVLDPNSETTWGLSRAVDAAGGSAVYQIQGEDTPNRLRQRIQRRAESLGYPVSAYSLRHQWASDRKAAGMQDADLAAALGHATDKSPQSYGRAQSGTAGTGLLSVSADRAIRRTASRAPWDKPTSGPGDEM